MRVRVSVSIRVRVRVSVGLGEDVVLGLSGLERFDVEFRGPARACGGGGVCVYVCVDGCVCV